MKLPSTIVRKLVIAAARARTKAYAPYSTFNVGAAVLSRSGKVFTGCNVENASYGATICAERTAITKAVSEGQKHIVAIAVVCDTPEPVAPCGICRQVIHEFGPDAVVIMANLSGECVTATMPALLPRAFGGEALKRGT